MTFLISIMLAAASPNSQFLTEQDLIRRARTTQNEAINSGNLSVVASFWTEDVTIRTGLGQVITGKENYKAAFQGTNVIYIRTPEFIEISSKWPLAYESGTWVGITGEFQISGRYAAQWIKRDKWLIRSEVFVALDAEGDCPLHALP